MKVIYSIIVPIYKVEKYLSQCIDSILFQTFKNFELILVNDGSPDNCPKICDEYAKKDSRIKVINKENGGLVSARKAGIDAANGEYICFVDGDDFICSDMLEKFDSILAEEKYDALCAEYSKYFNENHVVRIKQNVETGYYDKNKLTNYIYTKMLSSSNFFTFGVMPNLVTKCIKKSILCKIYKDVPDNISLGEDVAVSYPVLLQSGKVFFIDYSGYMYRQNLDSMTHTYDKNLFEKVKNLILYLKAVAEKMKWHEGNQINEYAVYLLILAKNNESKYNKNGSYFEYKNNMNRYLKDPLFEKILENTKLKGIKNKCILFCFKNKLILPIYLYEKIVNPRG